MAVQPITASDPMDVLYRDLQAKNMNAVWRQRVPERAGQEGMAAYPPYRWRWADIEPFTHRALDLVHPGRGQESDRSG